MNDGSDVIRDLLVRLGVMVDPGAAEDLDRFDRQVDAVREGLDAMASVAVAATTALAGLVVGGVALATGAAANAEQIERQAQALEVTTRQLQETQLAFELFDGSAELATQTLSMLRERAVQAEAGADAMVEAFGRLGISSAQLATQNPVELFEALAESVASADDQAQALSATTMLLGEDVARRLAPMLVQGGEGLRQLREEAHALGLITEEGTLRATAELNLQWRRLLQVGRALREELGQALAPTVERITTQVLDWVRANRELISDRLRNFAQGAARAIELLGPPIAVVTAGLVALRAALAGVAVAQWAAALVASVPLLATYGTAIVATIGLLAWLALVIEDVVVWFQGGNSAVGENIRLLMSWIPLGEELYEWLAAIADVARSTAEAIGRIGWALLQGLAGPVIDQIMAKLQPLLDRLRHLRITAEALGRLFGVNISADASGLRELADAIDRVSMAAAPAVEGAAARAVGRELERGSPTINNDNRSSNVSQSVTVNGQADGSMGAFVDSLLRGGREAVVGGVR